jgi:hypothetical protein
MGWPPDTFAIVTTFLIAGAVGLIVLLARGTRNDRFWTAVFMLVTLSILAFLMALL